MADRKITALEAAASVTSDDLLVVVDDPAGTPTTKKATVAQVVGAVDVAASDVSFTPAGSIAATDVQAAVAEVDSEKLAKASNLSDVGNAATAFGNIKQAATTDASGVVELATSAEIQAGTDSSRVASISGLIEALRYRHPPVPLVSGAWYSCAGNATAQILFSTGAAGRMSLLPAFLRAGSYDRIAVTTSASGTSTWRLGVYPSGTNGLPDSQAPLHDAGTVDTSVAPGVLAITTSFTIPYDGVYWLAVLVTAYTGQPTFRAFNSTSAVAAVSPFQGAMVNATTDAAAGIPQLCRWVPSAGTGALPTLGSSAAVDGAPRVIVRAV